MTKTTSPLAGLLLLALAVPAAASVRLWHPSMYGWNSATAADQPQGNNTFADWWFQGYLGDAPAAGEALTLPAGGTLTGELAATKAGTSWGASPASAAVELGACALAIAFEADAAALTQADFTVISIADCSGPSVAFDIPAALPRCPEAGCHCLWSSVQDGHMYNLGYRCQVEGGWASKPGHDPLPQPVAPRACAADADACVVGAKQPLFWGQAEGNNVAAAGPPAYTPAFGFSAGVQDDFMQHDGRVFMEPAPADCGSDPACVLARQEGEGQPEGDDQAGDGEEAAGGQDPSGDESQDWDDGGDHGSEAGADQGEGQDWGNGDGHGSSAGDDQGSVNGGDQDESQDWNIEDGQGSEEGADQTRDGSEVADGQDSTEGEGQEWNGGDDQGSTDGHDQDHEGGEQQWSEEDWGDGDAHGSEEAVDQASNEGGDQAPDGGQEWDPKWYQQTWTREELHAPWTPEEEEAKLGVLPHIPQIEQGEDWDLDLSQFSVPQQYVIRKMRAALWAKTASMQAPESTPPPSAAGQAETTSWAAEITAAPLPADTSAAPAPAETTSWEAEIAAAPAPTNAAATPKPTEDIAKVAGQVFAAFGEAAKKAEEERKKKKEEEDAKKKADEEKKKQAAIAAPTGVPGSTYKPDKSWMPYGWRPDGPYADLDHYKKDELAKNREQERGAWGFGHDQVLMLHDTKAAMDRDPDYPPSLEDWWEEFYDKRRNPGTKARRGLSDGVKVDSAETPESALLGEWDEKWFRTEWAPEELEWTDDELPYFTNEVWPHIVHKVDEVEAVDPHAQLSVPAQYCVRKWLAAMEYLQRGVENAVGALEADHIVRTKGVTLLLWDSATQAAPVPPQPESTDAPASENQEGHPGPVEGEQQKRDIEIDTNLVLVNTLANVQTTQLLMAAPGQTYGPGAGGGLTVTATGPAPTPVRTFGGPAAVPTPGSQAQKDAARAKLKASSDELVRQMQALVASKGPPWAPSGTYAGIDEYIAAEREHDPAFWISPAQLRYLDSVLSAEQQGFAVEFTQDVWDTIFSLRGKQRRGLGARERRWIKEGDGRQWLEDWDGVRYEDRGVWDAYLNQITWGPDTVVRWDDWERAALDALLHKVQALGGWGAKELDRESRELNEATHLRWPEIYALRKFRFARRKLKESIERQLRQWAHEEKGRRDVVPTPAAVSPARRSGVSEVRRSRLRQN